MKPEAIWNWSRAAPPEFGAGGKFPAYREFSSGRKPPMSISLFKTEAWRQSGEFPGAANSEAGRPEQRHPNAEQGNRNTASPRLVRYQTGRSMRCDCGNFSGGPATLQD